MIASRSHATRATFAAFVAIAASCSDSASPPAVASVAVAPESTTIVVGGSAKLSVSLRDPNDNLISGLAVGWSTSDRNAVTVSASGAVTGLSPGRAVITATSGGRTGTAVVLVIPERDYAIVDAQFTQAIQSADGSIPMVLGGNGAAVNVLMSSTAVGVVPMQLVLRLFDDDGNLAHADTLRISTPLGMAPTYAAPSAQFLVPASVLAVGSRWQIVRDPGRRTPDDVPENDVFPRRGSAPLLTVAVPPLKVRFVPIVLTAYGNITGNVSTANIPEYLRLLESIYPLATIEASVGASLSTGVSFGTPPRGGDAAQFWGPVLADLDLARVTDPDPATHWIGVVRPPPAFNYTITGGLAYVPSSGLSSGVGTRTSTVTSLGWANDPGFTREAVAHELGHNFGRRHAPCGNPANVDPAYPHSGGVIGLPGHDVHGWMAGIWATAVSLPATSGDVMGYCSPMWVSDYTYRGILNFRRTLTAALSAGPRAVAGQRVRALVVRGTVVEGREVTLASVFTLDALPIRPEADGSYRLEGRADDGRVLFAYGFAPAEVDHAPGIGHFTFAIPLTGDIETALSTIEVRGPAGSARVNRLTAPAMLRAAATIEPQRAAGGLLGVTCADANARGILVRDANSGALLGTAGAGSMRVSVAAGTPLTLVCSDGIRSSTSRVIAP